MTVLPCQPKASNLITAVCVLNGHLQGNAKLPSHDQCRPGKYSFLSPSLICSFYQFLPSQWVLDTCLAETAPTHPFHLRTFCCFPHRYPYKTLGTGVASTPVQVALTCNSLQDANCAVTGSSFTFLSCVLVMMGWG